MQLTPEQREELGKTVWETWVAQQQLRNPGRAVGYAPWQTLTEEGRETNRAIGEAVIQRYGALEGKV